MTVISLKVVGHWKTSHSLQANEISTFGTEQNYRVEHRGVRLYTDP